MDIFLKYGALALANVIELELTDWFQGILALPTYFDLSDFTIWDTGFRDDHQIKLAYSYF
ncbi:hypothetical protein [Xenorhabdus sp. Sc-CR9]|uniref:hypothetical protein n=1 Tax=Xenorhabdus sp. Sc-CR9 TaxID=2584468 RepID=UPI001F2D7DA0|nr:hypothetical protein [Xenorhabdus sp. Sc-CR9]